MSGLGPRSLVLIAVAAALATANQAGAQVYKRTARDGTTYFTNIHTNPQYKRAALASTTTHEPPQRAAASQGMYSREIAEASAR